MRNRKRLSARERDLVVEKLRGSIEEIARLVDIAPFTVCSILQSEFKGARRG